MNYPNFKIFVTDIYVYKLKYSFSNGSLKFYKVIINPNFDSIKILEFDRILVNNHMN